MSGRDKISILIHVINLPAVIVSLVVIFIITNHVFITLNTYAPVNGNPHVIPQGNPSDSDKVLTIYP